MKNRWYCFFMLLLVVVGGNTAQPLTEAYTRATFVGDSASLNYRILYPQQFDKSRKYPVLLFLHGSGERGDDNQLQLVHGSELFLREDVRREFPAIIIFPQCRTEDYWSNADVDRSGKMIELVFSTDKKPTESMGLVMDLMDSMATLEHTDVNRMYVGGLSMGGMGTFEILYRKPELFAAAIAICGGGHPDMVERYDPDLGIWVFHGAQDDVVLPSNSIEMVIALKKSGIPAKFTLYKDANHNSWDAAFAEPNLLTWLFSNERKK